MREQQIDEAKENLEGLRASQGAGGDQAGLLRDIARHERQEELQPGLNSARGHLRPEIAKGYSLAA